MNIPHTKLNIPTGMLDAIIGGLGHRPFHEVNPIIMELVKQANDPVIQGTAQAPGLPLPEVPPVDGVPAPVAPV